MKKEMTVGRMIAAAVSCTIIIIFTIILVVAITSEDTSSNNDSSQSTTENATQQEQTEKVIYTDDNFKVTYVDFVDPQMGVTAFNLLLRIENNSDTKVIASLTEGYANDTAVFFGSGMPVEIKQGKNAVGAFVLGHANTGITSIDEINTLEFKIVLYNENYSEKILETEDIVLNIKELKD